MDEASYGFLSDWQGIHKEKVDGLKECNEYLVKQGFHHGGFLSIEPLWQSDDDKSAFGQVYFLKIWEHDRIDPRIF